MEKRNTVLLTVIGLATLLVAVIGATFAYFTAQMSSTGTTSELDVSTTKLGNTTFTFNSSAKQFQYLDYPGGLAVIGADVEFKKDTEDKNDNNEYDATFNLKITYTNETQTALPWKLYVVNNKDFDDADNSMDPKCQLKNYVEGANTYFWYGNTGVTVTGTGYKTDACTLGSTIQENLTSAVLLAEGNLEVGKSNNEGVIDKNTGITEDSGPITKKGDTLTVDETHPLSNRKMTTNNINKKYYYLVVEYPNKEDQTATDLGKPIKVKLEAEDIVSAVQAGQ